MVKVASTPKRKADHIRVNLERDVRSGLSTGLERLRFVHNAVPELDLRKVDLTQVFLGKKLNAPFLISSMTGGTKRAGRINLALAEAAQARNVAMGLGSQRAALERPSLEATFKVRHVAPDILLFANLGAVQLNSGYGVDQCRRAVDMVEADALILHLNPLQEAVQADGDVDFSHLLAKIKVVCRQLGKPVIAKEVGWGISARAASRLVEAGVAAIDVAGAGGTSWSQVEMHLARTPMQASLAAAFVQWGIPTAEAVTSVRRQLPTIPLIASGGLRTGIDIAKCIALGADLGGMAGPLFRAATLSAEAVVEAIDAAVNEIRICLFATGSGDLAALRKAELKANE